jgi:homopolymeric O-antigen transport system permease protein
MKDYLNAVWRCRYFWLSLVKMDLRTRYRGSLIGLGWSLLNPIAMAIILCIAFHKIFQINVRDFAPFLLPGLAFWSFLATAMTQGCTTMTQNETYIRQFPAPLAIYPLRTVLVAGIHFLITLVVTLAVTWALRGADNLAALAVLPVSLALIGLFAWSLCVVFSFVNIYLPDSKHLLDVGLQLLFYATPVLYPPEVLRAGGIGWLVHCNPLTPFVNLLREPIFDARIPGWETMGAACLVLAVTGALAVGLLARLQQRLIYHL